MRKFIIALVLVFISATQAQAAPPPGDVSCSGTDTGIICSVSLNFTNGYVSLGSLTYYWDFAKNTQTVYNPYDISSYGTRTFFRVTEPNVISLTYQELLLLAGGDASATLVFWASPANSSNGGLIKNSSGGGIFVALADVLANKLKAEKAAAEKAAAEKATEAAHASLAAYHTSLVSSLKSSLERVQGNLHTFQVNFPKDSNVADFIEECVDIEIRTNDFNYLQPTATRISIDSVSQSLNSRIDTLVKKIEAAAEAAAKATADKAAADAAAKATADKAAADAAAKATADKAAADAAAKASINKATADKAAATKKITITCIKGKATKTVTAVKPVCPAGYRKK